MFIYYLFYYCYNTILTVFLLITPRHLFCASSGEREDKKFFNDAEQRSNFLYNLYSPTFLLIFLRNAHGSTHDNYILFDYTYIKYEIEIVRMNNFEL
jgi:hypothetical protein